MTKEILFILCLGWYQGALALASNAVDVCEDAMAEIDAESSSKELIENAILTLQENCLKEDSIRTEVYIAAAYSRIPAYENKVNDKIFWSTKAEKLFSKIEVKNPEYAFVYAMRGLSNSNAPDFLELHEMAQKDFEKALSLVPADKAERSDDDWDAFAITMKFYPPLLEKMIKLKINKESNSARLRSLSGNINI